jgi:hypothetical protein
MKERGIKPNPQNLKGKWKGWIPQVDWKNEYAAWMMIQNVCNEALKRYPQTLEQDRFLWVSDNVNHQLTYNARNCVMYRMGEKTVWQWYLDASKMVFELLKV